MHKDSSGIVKERSSLSKKLVLRPGMKHQQRKSKQGLILEDVPEKMHGKRQAMETKRQERS